MDHHYHIIGGGIGGVSMALGLQKNNCSFTLYEKAPEISYAIVGLGISENIFPVLQEWGILEEVKSIGTDIRRMQFVNKQMKLLKSLKFRHPALSVNRALFQQILAGKVRSENIKLNSNASILDLPGTEVIIAADGQLSGTRRMLFPHLRLRRSGQYLWRGIATIPLDHSYHHTYFDFIGGNTRFAIIHAGGDHYCWYAISKNSFADKEKTEEVKMMLMNLLDDYSPVAKEVISSTEHIYKSELVDMDPAERAGINWYWGNVVFLGDAIHPTTPNMANGACLAMEDAYVLSQFLKIWEKEPQRAFHAYQQARERKVNKIVHRSWALGQMMHQDNKLLDGLMQAGTRLTPQWAFDLIYSDVLDNESIQRAKGMWKA